MRHSDSPFLPFHACLHPEISLPCHRRHSSLFPLSLLLLLSYNTQEDSPIRCVFLEKNSL